MEFDYWYFLSRQHSFFCKINVRWLEFRKDVPEEMFALRMMFGASQQSTSGVHVKTKIHFHNQLDHNFQTIYEKYSSIDGQNRYMFLKFRPMHVLTFKWRDRHENMSDPEDIKGICFWYILLYIKQISKNSAIDTPEQHCVHRHELTWTYFQVLVSSAHPILFWISLLIPRTCLLLKQFNTLKLFLQSTDVSLTEISMVLAEIPYDMFSSFSLKCSESILKNFHWNSQ